MGIDCDHSKWYILYKIARVDGFDLRSLFEHRSKLNEDAKTHIDSYKASVAVWENSFQAERAASTKIETDRGSMGLEKRVSDRN